MFNDTNTKSASNEKKSGCPCMDMNDKYAKGFSDDDDAYVEEDITLEEDNNN